MCENTNCHPKPAHRNRKRAAVIFSVGTLMLGGGVAFAAWTHSGTGQANALVAVQAGVTQLDSSVGGLGGCPFAPGASGNIATEELVYMLEESGVGTGLDLDAVLAAAAVTEKAVGHALPSSLYRAGGRSVPRGTAG